MVTTKATIGVPTMAALAIALGRTVLLAFIGDRTLSANASVTTQLLFQSVMWAFFAVVLYVCGLC